MEDFGLALELTGVGMITVFIILSLVVLLGTLIIRFVNKYLPEEVRQLGSAVDNATELNKKKLAAIVSAVKIITKGKGRVSHIEKI